MGNNRPSCRASESRPEPTPAQNEQEVAVPDRAEYLAVDALMAYRTNYVTRCLGDLCEGEPFGLSYEPLLPVIICHL